MIEYSLLKKAETLLSAPISVIAGSRCAMPLDIPSRVG